MRHLSMEYIEDVGSLAVDIIEDSFEIKDNISDLQRIIEAVVTNNRGYVYLGGNGSSFEDYKTALRRLESASVLPEWEEGAKYFPLGLFSRR